MLFNTLLLSLLAISLSSAFAAPIPDPAKPPPARPSTRPVGPRPRPSRRDLATLEDATSFEKRSPTYDFSGGLNIFERGLGDGEALELYIRDLEAQSEQELLARGFDEGVNVDLERRSFWHKIGKVFKKAASFVMKRDIAPESEINLMERDEPEAKLELFERGVVRPLPPRPLPKPPPRPLPKPPSKKQRRSVVPEAEIELIERDEPEAKLELFERGAVRPLPPRPLPKPPPRPLPKPPKKQRRSAVPEAEIELMERDGTDTELELFERDFVDSEALELFERDEFEPELEIFERDFEPEYEMELFE